MKLDTYCETCQSHRWCGRPCLNRPINNLSPLQAQRPEEARVIHEEAPISKEALDSLKGMAAIPPLKPIEKKRSEGVKFMKSVERSALDAPGKRRAQKKLPPMEHPEGEIEASNKSRVPELQKKVDEVQAKKRGRPLKKTPEERREAARERMRKRRTEKRRAK